MHQIRDPEIEEAKADEIGGNNRRFNSDRGDFNIPLSVIYKTARQGQKTLIMLLTM